MSIKAVIKTTLTMWAAVCASAAVSQDVPVISVINVKTTDPQGYAQYLADNPQIMSSLALKQVGLVSR